MAGCFQTRLILVPLLPTGHFSIYIFKMHRSTFLNYTKPTDRWILRVWNGEMFGQLYASSSLLCLSSFALPKEGGVWHIAALSNLNVPILSLLLRLWLFTFVQVTTYLPTEPTCYCLSTALERLAYRRPKLTFLQVTTRLPRTLSSILIWPWKIGRLLYYCTTQ